MQVYYPIDCKKKKIKKNKKNQKNKKSDNPKNSVKNETPKLRYHFSLFCFYIHFSLFCFYIHFSLFERPKIINIFPYFWQKSF